MPIIAIVFYDSMKDKKQFSNTPTALKPIFRSVDHFIDSEINIQDYYLYQVKYSIQLTNVEGKTSV